MLRRTSLCWLFSKPITQGYVAQFPSPINSPQGKLWARAERGNRDVREAYAPDAERYEEWYKTTYALEDLSDGCAASGASSNKRLDDTRNMQAAVEEYDLEGVKEELDFWSQEFHHNTLVR